MGDVLHTRSGPMDIYLPVNVCDALAGIFAAPTAKRTASCEASGSTVVTRVYAHGHTGWIQLQCRGIPKLHALTAASAYMMTHAMARRGPAGLQA